MKWSVEVTSLTKSAEKRAFQIEADSWQLALEDARKQLGDEGHLGGFSIDLLKEGYRAVDPTSMRKFVIRSIGPDGKVPSMPPTPGQPFRPLSVPPAAPVPAEVKQAAQPADAVDPPAPTAAAKAGATKVIAPKAERTEPLPDTHLAKKGPAERPSQTLKPPGLNTSAKEAGRAHDRASLNPPLAKLAATLLSQRAEDPSDKSPLTYRERVYALPMGTEEAQAEGFARAMLKSLQRELPEGRTNVFVNIAVFDEIFTGPPTIAPLAVLEWKDWKGDAVARFPRRHPSSRVAAQHAPRRSQRPASVPPPALAPLDDMFLGPALAPGTIPPKGLGGVVQPSLAAPLMPNLEPVQDDSAAAKEAFLAAAPQLKAVADPVMAAYFALDLALAKIPAAGGLLHIWMQDAREFIVVAARGNNAPALVKGRHADADPFLARALTGDATVLCEPSGALVIRFAVFGGLQHLALAPLWGDGRCVGALELINRVPGPKFNEVERGALHALAAALGERLAAEAPSARVVDLDRPPPPVLPFR